MKNSLNFMSTCLKVVDTRRARLKAHLRSQKNRDENWHGSSNQLWALFEYPAGCVGVSLSKSCTYFSVLLAIEMRR
jgi:hypothetical protein